MTVLHVLMVTPGFYPVTGGTETIVRNLSKELNTKGIHTDVLTFNMTNKWKPKWRGETTRIDGMNVFRIPGLNWQPFEHSMRNTMGVNLIPGCFAKLMGQYDLIHFHELDFSFPLFSLSVKKPKVLQPHGMDSNFLRRYYLGRKILTNVANHYIAISMQAKKDLLEIGIPNKKLTYLPNGVDTELFRPKTQRQENLILFVGRIQPLKGLHVLIESLRYLRTPVHLVVIGSFWDNKYSNDMKTLADKEEKRGKHKIEFLGALDPEEVSYWYQKASIFILSSFSEGLPVVVIEALSCATPVVVTSVGGIPDIVKNNENGLYFRTGDSVDLAKKIQYLLDNRSERVRLGQEGRRQIIANFSLTSVVTQLSALYQRLLED